MKPAVMFQPITPAEDAVMAGIIRQTLRAYRLDLPGTAYFDASLDGLSACYAAPNSGYWVLHVDGRPVGGGGFAAFSGFPDCCELQKLYLTEAARGLGFGAALLAYIETPRRAGISASIWKPIPPCGRRCGCTSGRAIGRSSGPHRSCIRRWTHFSAKN